MPRKRLLPAIMVMLLPVGAAAQDAGIRAGYQPKLTAQVPPMRVEVVDGTRFRDIETRRIFRLFAIDACAPGQTATLGRQPWPCGTVAIAWLVGSTLNRWVTCAPIREDGSETVARCATASHPDLSAAMLREGVAVLAPAIPADPVIRAYPAAEEQARKAFRGVWSSAFQMPWDWRAEHGGRPRTAKAGEAMP